MVINKLSQREGYFISLLFSHDGNGYLVDTLEEDGNVGHTAHLRKMATWGTEHCTALRRESTVLV